MRRLLSFMLAILISSIAFGQIQPINLSKVVNATKDTKTSITTSDIQMNRVQKAANATIHYANPNKAITGTFSVSPTTYIPGQTMILSFNFNFSSNDYEYVDGISITFPTGITPQETNTSTSIGAASLVTPISGNTIVWGQVTTPSGWGDIVPGSYDFQVAVNVDASLTGSQSVVCYAMGDGYGSAPHSINQTLVLTPALAHDVAVSNILFQNAYSTGATITPKAIISNIGTSAETVSLNFVINDGTANVYTSTITDYAIASGQTNTITFSPDWIATTPGSYTAKCYLTTTDNNASNDTVTKAFIVTDPIWGFAWNAYDPDAIIPTGPVKVNLATAEIIPIGSYTGTDFLPGADFIRGEWYASSYDGLSLLTIDTTTGNMTTIGNLGLVMNGLAYDATTDKLYGCAYDGSANSILYEINYNNGTYTQIGTISAGIMIGIAANSHGNLYGVNISDDALYSINKTTGAGTVIGSLGYDIGYAQDIAFDKDNDKLYGALYATEGLLGEIDTLTGTVTVYNTMTCELTGLAFPYAYTLNNNDIAITNIDLPASGCDVSATNSISITLKNAGVNEQSNIPVKISINNGTPITETVAGPIASGATLNHTFSQNFDFSADGVYNITAYSALATDENHNNDTIHGVVNNYIPTTVPTTINFDDINLLNRYTIIDNNGDDNSWFYLNNPTYAHSGNIALAYSFSDVNSADEYFFSSCIDLNAGEIYKISLWYRVAGTSYPESFEVYLATEPSVAGIIGSPIISMNNVNNTTYAETTANNVTVSNDGTYYISVRATSEADMYALFIDDITIDFSNSIVENENNFSIYPNPANDLLIINSAISMNQITIINNLGQVVMNVEPNTDTYQINTSTLPEGIYTARIITKNGLSTKLIVVAH